MNSIRKSIEHSEVGKASQKLVDAGSTVGSAVSGGAKWATKRLGFGGRRLLECPKCAKKSDVEKMLSGAGKVRGPRRWQPQHAWEASLGQRKEGSVD